MIHNEIEYRRYRAMFVFVGILSSPHNFAARSAIRDTWVADAPFRVTHKFVIARPDASVDGLAEEIEAYGDIILMHWQRDSYYSITNKTLEIFRIGAAFERDFKFTHIFKADDDTYVRMRQLGDLLMSCPERRTWVGHHNLAGAKPDRAGGQWSLSVAEYPRDQFPAWTSGVLYGVTSDVARWVATQPHLPIHLRLEDIQFALWMEALEKSGPLAKCGRSSLFNPLGCRREDIASHYIDPRHMRCIHRRGVCCSRR